LVCIAIVSSRCGTNGEPRTCSVPTTNQDRRRDRSHLSVATLNAEWLFWDDGNDGPSNKCPRSHSQGTCPWEDGEEAEAHIVAVAKALKIINADIIAVEEVLDCVVLQCLIDYMEDNTYRPYLIPGTDSATDQNVGIISRIDPLSPIFRTEARETIYREESPCGQGLPQPSYNSGVSKHFIARFNVPGLGPLTLIGLHFLAFPVDPDRCIRREAQATVIKKVATAELQAGRQVIVLGDLNDYDFDVIDRSNSRPISRVSRLLKLNDQGAKVMVSAAEYIPLQSDRYSSWWDRNNNCVVEPGELTLIDHLFVSDELKDVIVSTRIYNTIELCGSLQSDHYPVKIVFSTSQGGYGLVWLVAVSLSGTIMALIYRYRQCIY